MHHGRHAISRTVRRLGFYMAASIVFMVTLTALFTVFYRYTLEDTNWLDSLYFTIITSKTIGFGDIHPTTTVGKIGTMLNALLPATIFVGASLVVIESLFKAMEIYWKDFLMSRHQDHTLIIAEPDILAGLVSECVATHQDYVVIDPRPIDDLPETAAGYIDESLYLQGDPRDDTTLRRAGVTHAQRVIVACKDDATSLFVLVSCKGLNPNLKSTVRVISEENVTKFRAVGADYLLPASTVTGRMLSLAALHPIAHQFLLNLHTESVDPKLVEIKPESTDLGRQVRDVYPLAVAVHRDGRYQYDLTNHVIAAADTILCITLSDAHA